MALVMSGVRCVRGALYGPKHGPRGRLRRCSPGPFGFLEQLVHGRVDRLVAGAADPLVPDNSLKIQEVERRGRGEVPPRSDVARVRERPPGQFLLVHELLEPRGVVAGAVDADQGEGLVLESRDERPLVGPLTLQVSQYSDQRSISTTLPR